jgi:hypothetical protein
MVHTAQTTFLVAAEKEVCTAVRAVSIQQTYLTLAITEGYQMLSKHGHPNRRAISHRDLLCEHYR